MRPFVYLAASAVALCVTPVARAQPSPQASYDYRFDDDSLVGDTIDGTPPLIRVSTRRPRIALLRPRASFIPEMLESVEDL